MADRQALNGLSPRLVFSHVRALRLSLSEIDRSELAAFFAVPNRSLDVRLWHKADMLTALTNVRFWE